MIPHISIEAAIKHTIMNLLAYVIAGTGGLVGILIHLLILVLIFALVWWVLTLIPLPPPIAQVVRVIFAIIAVIILISFLLGIAGCVTNPITGKKTLDPNVQNQLVAVASAEIHGLANDYLQTGKVDYKKDLISGALSQVYTLEGTATPATQASVGAVVGTVITDPGLKAAVTSAAVNTINAVPAGTTKPVAINGALSALDLALQKVTVASP